MASKYAGTSTATGDDGPEWTSRIGANAPADILNNSRLRLTYALFINRTDCFLAGNRDDGWFCVKSQLMPATVDMAQRGIVSIGAYAVSEMGTAKWVCLDADNVNLVWDLAQLVKQYPDCSFLEYSRRGCHAWFFCEEDDWRLVNAWGRQLVIEAELTETLEIYPKHAGLHGVRLPGSPHVKDSVVYPVVDPETGERLELESVLSRMRPRPLPYLPIVEEQRQEIPTGNVFTEPGIDVPDECTAFWELIEALAPLTELRVYSEGRASGRCPWHDDRHPSFGVDGSKFRCFSDMCSVWGDIHDVRRWIERGIRPPH